VWQRSLPKLDKVAVVRRFIKEDEHPVLLDWAERQFENGCLAANPAGPGRYFARYEEGGDVPDLFWEVRRRAVATFSVEEYEDEPRFRCFLGCNTDGGFVAPHKDPSPPGKRHVRMNIMLSMPKRGGYPVIEGKTYRVEERDLWCFYPTLMRHGSKPMAGERKRFLISIGILVPETERPASDEGP
jgi:hypothetical protein